MCIATFHEQPLKVDSQSMNFKVQIATQTGKIQVCVYECYVCKYNLQYYVFEIEFSSRNLNFVSCHIIKSFNANLVLHYHAASRFGRMPREERLRLLEELNQEENEQTAEDKHRLKLRLLSNRVHDAYKDIWSVKFQNVFDTNGVKVKQEGWIVSDI